MMETFNIGEKVYFIYPHFKAAVVEVLKIGNEQGYGYVVKLPDDYDEGPGAGLTEELEVNGCWLHSVLTQNVF